METRMIDIIEEYQKPVPGQGQSLTKTTGKALSWNYLGSFVRLTMSLGVNILMARLLGPRPFGELAVAMLLFGLGNLLSGIGVATALIQKKEINNRDIRFCFTCQMIVGASVSLVLIISAPLWAVFFHQPELTLLLRVLSPLFLFQSFGTISTALLNRKQNTRHIQVASIVSYVFAFGFLGIPMALLGYGVWSLVAAYLSQTLVNGLILYLHVRHSVLPLLYRGGVTLLRFGFSVLGANLSNWGISNLDNAVVGRVSGPVALGLYSRAFTLASLPAEGIIGNLLGVLLPSFSRIQTDTKRLARIYLAAVGLVALVLLPPFCAMAAVPGVIVLGLYGAKWIGAVWLFQPLALAIPVNAMMALSGPTLASRGKPHLEMRLQFVVLLVAIAGYSISVRYSVLWLSWTVVAVYLLRFALLTGAALREVGVRWSEIARAVWPAIVLAGFASGTAALINLVFPATAMWIRLISVAAGTALPTILFLIVGRGFFLDPILRTVPQIQELLYAKFSFLRPWEI
jgi:PST family polysaccharide transporter